MAPRSKYTLQDVIEIISKKGGVCLSEQYKSSEIKIKCPENHEFVKTFGQLQRGDWCPYCSGRKLGYGNSLADQHKNLMAEWDYENNEVKPSQVTSGSRYCATWKCENGHRWKTGVYHRTKAKPTGCPYCSGRLPLPKEALKDLHPELMLEWDKEKNTLDPSTTHPGTLKKAHWICGNGHRYKKSIRSRTVTGTGCDQCNSFEFNFPEIAKEWHPTKNKKKANEVAQSSGSKVWWLCDRGHEWPAVVSSRQRHGCPYCAGLKVSETNNFAFKMPSLVQYWDNEKNAQKPNEVAWQTNKKFSFVCEKGHPFSAKLNNISNGKWCPYCSGQKVGYGNSLKDQNPSLANEWHLTKNKLNASQVTAGANKKAWWECEKGHEWQALISSRNQGNGCPYCANRLVGFGNSLGDLYPDLLQEIDYEKSPIDPFEVMAGSTIQIWWKCKFGHSWKAPIARRTSNKSGCRFCTSQTSSPEIRLFTELKEIFGEALGREKVEGKEVDILLPTLKVAVEYDGAYYHRNNVGIDEEKKALLETAGFKVFRMREKPLPLSDCDVAVKPDNSAPTKAEFNNLVEKILEVMPVRRSKYENYLNKESFIAEQEYKRILSYLPGPPEEDSLAELYPDLSKQWNAEKNYPLTPKMFHPASGKKVWWRCEKGHEWQATIDKRSRAGRGCPYCSNKKVGYGNSLKDRYPEIAKMWYQPQNGELTPADVTFGSGFKAWWVCQNGHFSRARVADKVKKSKCLYCPGIGRNRKYTPPEFSE